MTTLELTPLTAAEIARLSEQRNHPSISIYLPTFSAGNEVQQNSIRFKNMLREAERLLADQGLKADCLAPAQELLQDGPFWSHQQDGLAVFISPQQGKVYQLPFPVEEKVQVNHRFHIKPLLWYHQYKGRFYVVALSLRQSKLFECSVKGHREVELPDDIPKGVEDIRAWEDTPDENVTVHGGSGNGQAWHGYGSRNEFDRDVQTFITQLEKGIDSHVKDRSPLVLAGVEELVAAYRQANHHVPLISDALLGSPEGTQPKQLRERAWELVAPEFQREREATRQQLLELQGIGEKSSRDIPEIVSAAYSGRVDALLLPDGLEVYGKFDTQTLQTTVSDKDDGEDLLDLAALYTLQKGGKVFLFEPGTLDRVGAILRY